MCMAIGWFLPQKDVQNVHFQQISTVHVQSTKNIQQKKNKQLDTNVNQKSKNLALQCTLDINSKNCNHYVLFS